MRKTKMYYLIVPVKIGGNSNVGQNFHHVSGAAPDNYTIVTAANNLCYGKSAISDSSVKIDSLELLCELVRKGVKGFSDENILQNSLKSENHWDIIKRSASSNSGLNLLKEGKTTLLHWQSGVRLKKFGRQ